MFFLLSKILKFLTSPLTWIFIPFLFAFFTRQADRKGKILKWALLVFWLLTNAFLADEFMRVWEVPVVHLTKEKKYEAGIVLGGLLIYDPSNQRTQFIRSGDRLFQAIRLYKEGFCKKIFFVGGSGFISSPDQKEGIYVKEYLLAIGIPETDIIIESESRNTYENAIYAKDLAVKNNLSGDFLLITSGVHMKRAIRCFEHAGLHVQPYSTDRFSGPRKYAFDHLFIPDLYTLMTWDVLIHEWIGFVAYLAAGYI